MDNKRVAKLVEWQYEYLLTQPQDELDECVMKGRSTIVLRI